MVGGLVDFGVFEVVDPEVVEFLEDAWEYTVSFTLFYCVVIDGEM